MLGLGDNITQLAALRKLRAAVGAGPAANSAVLTETTSFGANPGALRMLSYVPPGLHSGAPLVVVLHGCTQTGAAYDHGSGWSQLAARHGFALLFPEQQRSNNANLCFNWFQPADVQRNSGEVASIQQMITHMLQTQPIDPARIYVTGLSAGGAIAAAMLATYPELFAGGAIIAGMPFGSAVSIPTAFEAMSGGRARTAPEWGDLVRAAAPARSSWPAVQIWQGTADTTVRPANATELLKQWSNVHGLSLEPHATDLQDGARHEVWRDTHGRVMLESYLVTGMAHGTPLDTGDHDLDHAVGHAGPHMLDVDIASTWHIASGWSLLTQTARARSSAFAPGPPQAKATPDSVNIPQAANGVRSVIENALRAAGLMGR